MARKTYASDSWDTNTGCMVDDLKELLLTQSVMMALPHYAML